MVSIFLAADAIAFKKDLPLFKAVISEDEQSGVELQAVALVADPAIQEAFVAFSAARPVRFSMDEDRHILTGPLLIPEMPVYRRFPKEQGGECYIMYDAETIYAMVQRYFKKGYQNQVNAEHDPKQKIAGVTMFESFISDPARGIAPMRGYEDLPAGTWFGSFYVDNPETWAEVKEGRFTGFSIEGRFYLEPTGEEVAEEPLSDEARLNALLTILSQEYE